MALKYILGNSGFGKTAFCIKEIIQCEQQGKNIIFIVPEQFTLEGERLIIDAMPNKSMLHTQVLSFKRLAYRLSEELGGTPNKVLTPQGKIMLLRKIVFQLSDRLEYFSKVIDKQGFLEQLSLIIREFFQYNITPEILENLSQSFGENEGLSIKIRDLKLIYQSYIEYINNYITDEQHLTLICDKLENSALIRDAEIWIDGFTGFTPQEFSVIRKLMQAGRNVTVSLILNSKNINFADIQPFDPFYESKTTIKKLNKIAAECKIPMLPAVYLSKDLRHIGNSEMAFLKQGYFSNIRYNEPLNNIGIFSASTMYAEIDIACRKIVELVRERGLRYDDIAVILGSKSYEKPLKTAFDNYKIPNFIDSGVSALSHPFTDFILSLFEIINYNFSYRSVCRCLKSGILKMDFKDICILENYILANGIKGYKWSYKEWKYYTNEDILKINSLKNQFLKCIEPLTSQIKNDGKYTVRHISTILFELFENIGVTDTLSEWIEQANEEKDFIRAKLHSQVWDLLVGLFEKMVEILGDEVVTPMEYYKILSAGLSNCEMGLIPPTQDHIIVGNSTRTRLPEIKAMLVLGVTEGCLPQYVKDVGVLSDLDREYITGLGYEVAPDNRQKINLDRLAIFMTLTKPKETLYLSYPTGSIKSDKLRPSSIIHKFRSMFPELKEEAPEENADFSAPEPALGRLAVAVSAIRSGGELPDAYKDAYSWFMENPEYKQKLMKIQEGILSDVPVEYLSGSVLEKLYGNKLYLSVSRLEKFAACPFSFFMEYVIKARERQEYELYTPLSIGNIYHNSLKLFSDALKEMPHKDWNSITKADIENMVNDSVDKVVETSVSDIMMATGKFRYAVKRVKDYLNRSVWALSEHIKAGCFVPSAYEISFGIDGDMPAIVYRLDNGKELLLNGKIDRVDVFNKDNKQYIKVIDYKSSASYSLDEIYYGLNPQLILYLDALVKNQQAKAQGQIGEVSDGIAIDKGMTAMPGGMFYFGVDNPLVEIKTDVEPSQVLKSILKKFNMNGLILDDDDVINAIDREYNKEKKRIRSLDKSDFADINRFNALREHSVEVAKKYGQEILNGNIDVLPYKHGKKTGCDYCVFSSICRIDTIERKNKYRNLDSLNASAILNHIVKEGESNET